MKLTPAAIRQHSFETVFRGYEKKEVSLFLDEVSEIVDKLHQENLELKSKLQNTEFEAKRLKDVEDSLFRTLKTAEDTGASIIEEANEAADLIIAEANHTAQHATEHAHKIITEAKKKAEEQSAILIDAAERKAKDTILELRQNIETLVISYESLAKQRDELVINLKKLSQEALNQAGNSEVNFKKIDANAHLTAIKELEKSDSFVIANIVSITQQVDNVSEQVLHEDSSQVEELTELAMNEVELIEEVKSLENLDQASEIEILDSPSEEIKEFVVDQQETLGEQMDLAEPKKIEEEFEEKSIEAIEIHESKVLPKEEEKTDEIIFKAPEEKKNQSGSFFDEFN
jgi:cell division initiation protein